LKGSFKTDGMNHDRSDLHGRGGGIVSGRHALCPRLRAYLTGTAMLFDYLLGGGAVLALLGYMTFAVIWPEKL